MRSHEVHYKVAWRATGSYPGHHASQQKGGGLNFRNHVPLVDAPDPRRFDIRASLADPFEQIYVRVYQQTSSIPVYVVADLSASMQYTGSRSKAQAISEFVRLLSYSAYRTGDTFGFFGASEKTLPPLQLAPTFHRAAGEKIAQQLLSQQNPGSDSEGLINAAKHLGGRRALVFLLSDFHFSLDLVDRLLGSLSYHDVVPVVLWDRFEHQDLPKFGLARVQDPETNKYRTLLMRPSLNARIRESFIERRRLLDESCRRHGRRALYLGTHFEADEVSRYFFH